LDYREIARQKALKYGLLPEVFERQIGAESGFNPKAVSSAGALGIAQIMPSTAKGWGVDPRDPVAALDAAAKNMSSYIRTYGGFSTSDPYKVRSAYEKALQAYNAGPGSVGKYLPAETKNYISKIVGPDKFSFTQALQNAAFTEPTSSSLPASSTVEPVSLPRYDIKKAVEGIVGNFISKGLQPDSQSQDLSSQYLAKASELDELGTPEAMELAEAYRLKAIESTATVGGSTPDVASLYSGILGEKLKQIAYDQDAANQEEALNKVLQASAQSPTAQSPTGNVPTAGGGFALKGATITSPVDTSGEPGFDFVIPGGRGAAFALPFTGQVVGVEKNQNWETHLEKGAGKRGYGNWVDVRAIDPVTKKAFDVRFAHFDKVNPNLKVGQTITAGTPIGLQGRTGSTTGHHVSADFYNAGSTTASKEILGIRDRIRDRLAKGLPVF
jgi:murein DD-endopeptidase MepM/ murein hydrolase activator NlpD